MSNTTTSYRVAKIEKVAKQCNWCNGAKTQGRVCRNCDDTGRVEHERVTQVDLLEALHELQLIRKREV